MSRSGAVKLAISSRLRSTILIVGAAACMAAAGLLGWQAPTALAKPHRATVVATLHRQLGAVGAATRATLAQTISARALLVAEQRRNAHLTVVVRTQTRQIGALRAKARALHP
jgi:hypothetical protein